MAYSSPYIAILDVGHGNATVLRDGENVFVIDCGAKSSGLKQFLNEEGITKINKLFISHADADHIGGLVGIISTGEFVIDEIYFNSDGTKGSEAWDDLAYVLDELHESGETKFIPGISRTSEYLYCGNIGIEITGPTPYLVAKGAGGKDHYGRTINSNSLSASFKLSWGGSELAYISGDIDQIGLEDILRHKADLISPILVFPHHGGRAGAIDPIKFAELLCDAVTPSTVIFSIGRSRFENPRPEIVATVRKKISDVRISCTQLSKHCMKKIAWTKFDHLVEVYSRGKDDQFCCSGTFIVKLGDTIAHFPDISSHHAFIKSAALTPLCTS